MAGIINDNGGWAVDRITTRISDNIIRKIHLYKLPMKPCSNDKMVWKGNAYGIMMARSLYQFLMANDESRTSRKWKWVWRLDCLQKVRFLFGYCCRIVF